MKRILALLMFLALMIPCVSIAGEATPATHERHGRTNTYTWNAQSNVTGFYNSGASTYVTGLLWQVMFESVSGASAFAQGTGVSIVNSRGVDILGSDIGKSLNSVAGVTSTRTPLLYDGTYRWLDNEPLDMIAYGTGVSRIFKVKITVMD
jgi:hypothetical protein